jgi:VCBS repeat protein
VQNGAMNTLRGDGHGGYAAFPGGTHEFPAVNPHIVVAGRFDADEHVDLAVGVWNPHSVRVMLGKGNGTFDPQPGNMSLGAALELKAIDVNGDGELDLLGGAGASGLTEVALGTGTGTFGGAMSFDGGIGFDSGDLNNDGLADLASAGWDNPLFSASTAVGTGTASLFQPSPQPAIVLPGTPEDLAVEDLDDDGRLDAITANRTNDDLSVLTNVSQIPAVSHAVASGVTQESVDVTATVAPAPTPSAARAELEPVGGGPAIVTPGELLPGSGPRSVTFAVSGLEPGTAYRFRVVAIGNGAGTRGAWRTVTTASPPVEPGPGGSDPAPDGGGPAGPAGGGPAGSGGAAARDATAPRVRLLAQACPKKLTKRRCAKLRRDPRRWRRLRIAATDAGSGVAAVEVRIGRRTLRARLHSGVWTVPVKLRPGRVRISVRAVDGAGNASAPVVKRVRVSRRG